MALPSDALSSPLLYIRYGSDSGAFLAARRARGSQTAHSEAEPRNEMHLLGFEGFRLSESQRWILCLIQFFHHGSRHFFRLD